MNFTMSFSELMPLAPVMIVALTTIVVMILTAIKRNHNLIATASVVGLNLAAAYVLFTMFGGAFSNSFGNVVDGYGLHLRVHRFNVVL